MPLFRSLVLNWLNLWSYYDCSMSSIKLFVLFGTFMCLVSVYCLKIVVMTLRRQIVWDRGKRRLLGKSAGTALVRMRGI